MSELRPNLDPSAAQRRAADPAVSAWVDASAGSGKTKVLTDRVLALLLAGARPHAILCLTFTKAAAGEMANRVADRLARWVRAEAENLRKNLTDLLGRPPSDVETDRARRLFAKVQEAAGGVRIDTVHAFCQGVLQRFPAEANVPPHFDILEDRQQRLLLANARDGLVRAIAEAPDTLLAHAWNRTLERLSETAFAALSLEFSKERSRLASAQSADVAAALAVAPEGTAADLERAACQEETFDRARLIAAMQQLARASGKTAAKLVEGLEIWLSSSPENRNLESHLSLMVTKEGTARKFGRLLADEVIAAGIIGEQERLIQTSQHIARAKAFEDTQSLLVVAQDLLRRYEAAKRARSLLDYDDLILATERLLQDRRAAWVHFKLDGGIDHVLVDEAQDTNPAQWRVIAGLVAEFFAGNAQGERQRTLFAVGDPKQSIYSFQGADPAGFIERRIMFARDTTAAGQEWRDVPLTVSFRSAAPVLRLVDAVFANPSALGVGDTPVQHHAWRADAPGWIEVWPTVASAGGEGPGDVWSLPRDYEASLSAEERLARVVAQKIRGLLDSGEALHATDGKPIRAGDIMVLVRRRRRFGAALVSALKRLGVPVAGVDRMALARQLAVQDLVAFGQFLLLPDDDLTLAAVLKGPFFRWSEERLFQLAHGREGSLWQALQMATSEQDQVDAARLIAWQRRAKGLAPFALYSRLLTQEGGRALIRGYLGSEADDPVDEFLALALEFPRHGPPTMQGFLQWLAADDVEIKRELDSGARDEVRLLTVHAAKGLQAPIVFLPDTIRQQRDSSNSLIWIDNAPVWPAGKGARDPVSADAFEERKARERAEEARLLYVALTRAEDRLYVCGWESKNNKPGPNTWYGQVLSACERLEAEGAMQPMEVNVGELSGSGFAMGTPPVPAGQRGEARDAVADKLPYWAMAPAPPEPTPARPLAPSRPSPIAPALRSPLRDRGATERRFRRGTLLHRLLQHLPGIAPDQRLHVAAQVLSNSGLEAAEIEQLVQAVVTVLDDSRFAAVFATDALVEAPLTGLIDGAVVSGTVDRLLVTDTKVLIVDYKTNRNPPRAANRIPLAYSKQMRAYAALLQAVYPGRTIEAALLWTEVPRLETVPLAD